MAQSSTNSASNSENDHEKADAPEKPQTVGLFHPSLARLRLEVLGLWARTGKPYLAEEVACVKADLFNCSLDTVNFYLACVITILVCCHIPLFTRPLFPSQQCLSNPGLTLFPHLQMGYESDTPA